MNSSTSVETGLQLLARLSGRPNISNLCPVLFPSGFEKNQPCVIYGESSTGKSLLLYDLIITCILPTKFGSMHIGGFEAAVILIDTDQNNGILQAIHLIEQRISNVTKSDKMPKHPLKKDEKKAIIESSLRRLTILKTYSSDQLTLNLYTIGKLLSSNRAYSLVAIDSLSAFYWEDVVKLNGIRKIDLYIKVLMQKLQAAVEEHGVHVVVTRPAYFQSKSPKNFLYNFKYLVELRKSETGDGGEALIKANDVSKVCKYNVGVHGFSWLIE